MQLKLRFGENTITDDNIMSFKLYETLCDENFAFGKVNINYVEAEIYDLPNSISGCVLEPIVITDAEEEIPLGKFKAEKPKTEDNMTSFTAYSLLKYNTSDVYTSLLPTDQQGCAPLEDVWAEVCTQCKVEYEVLGVSDSVKVGLLEGLTLKEVLGQIAGFLGGNCTMNRNGKCCVKLFKETTKEMTEDMCDEPVIGEEKFTLNSLTCITNSETLTVGEGPGISFSNVLMTSERLKEILEENKSISYNDMEVNLLTGDSEITPGDIVVLRYASKDYSVPVMSNTIDYDGAIMNFLRANYTNEETQTDTVSISEKYKTITKTQSDFKKAQSEFSKCINSALGLHTTTKTFADGSVKYYYHNATTLESSTYIYTTTSEGFAYTNKWNGDDTAWQGGIDSSGNAILNTLSVLGINADWITSGSLVTASSDDDYNYKGIIADGKIGLETTDKETDENKNTTTIGRNGMQSVTKAEVFKFVQPDNWESMTTIERIAEHTRQIGEYLKKINFGVSGVINFDDGTSEAYQLYEKGLTFTSADAEGNTDSVTYSKEGVDNLKFKYGDDYVSIEKMVEVVEKHEENLRVVDFKDEVIYDGCVEDKSGNARFTYHNGLVTIAYRGKSSAVHEADEVLFQIPKEYAPSSLAIYAPAVFTTSNSSGNESLVGIVAIRSKGNEIPGCVTTFQIKPKTYATTLNFQVSYYVD